MEEQKISDMTQESSKKLHKRGFMGDRSVRMWRTWFSVVLVLFIALIVWAAVAWGNNGEARAVNTSEYQAVFLTNGQVYFGKLKVVNSNYLKLTDIYYLQVQSSATGSTAASELNSTSGSASNVQLIKLGSELQGPEDMMAVNREQVLFWENLKPSGKVTEAIVLYQKKHD